MPVVVPEEAADEEAPDAAIFEFFEVPEPEFFFAVEPDFFPSKFNGFVCFST